MPNHDRLVELTRLMLTELGWKPQSGDVIDAIACGGLLTVQQAAIICDVADQTVYRWLDDAERRGLPLGKKTATWLIGTDRLLAYVEKHQGGKPARVKAQNRLEQYWPRWSRPPALS